MKNVVELVRVSTEEQASQDRGGIPAQRATNRRTAEQHDLRIVKTIEIVDVSGSSVLRSPQMQELLKLMEEPEIHGVIAKEFSRLMRPENFADYAILQHFIDTGTVFYLPEGPIDLASKLGRLYGTIRAAMAGLERREIIERMQDGKEALRRAGKHPGSSASLPYGVGYSKEQGWSYTAEAEKVKQAFILFLSGKGYTEIAKELNLARANIRFILENPIYTGWRVYDEKRDPSVGGYIARADGRQGERKKIKRNPEEVIRVRVLEPLVSEEDFAYVQQLVELKRQKHWRAREETSRRYTYNGLLTCGECRSLVYTHSSKQDFYVCKSHHPRERRKRELEGFAPCSNRHMLRYRLEPKIDELFGAKLCDRGFLNRVVEAYNELVEHIQQPAGRDNVALKNKIDGLCEKRQRILEAFFDGAIRKEDRDRRFEEIDRELSVYRQLLTESANVPPQPPVLDLEAVSAVVQPFAEWEFLNRDDKRLLLANLCPEISVYCYEIRDLTLAVARGYEVSHEKTAW